MIVCKSLVFIISKIYKRWTRELWMVVKAKALRPPFIFQVKEEQAIYSLP